MLAFSRLSGRQSRAPGRPWRKAWANSINYGFSRGGVAVYWPGTEEDGVHPTVAVTQWFEATGEFWGVGGGFLFEREGDRLTLATGYFFQRWLHFLERNCALALQHGGSLPIHVRLGVSDLQNSWWPRGQFDFGDDGYTAVEAAYEYRATLDSVAPAELKRVAVEAFNGLAGAFGIAPFAAEEILDMSRF